MKRELIQNVKLQPYTSGTGVDREGFLSAIFAATAATAGALTVTVTHSDDDSTYAAATDPELFPDATSTDGVLTTDELAVGDTINLDMDLASLKKYVKIEVSGTGATDSTYALALGDAAVQPV